MSPVGLANTRILTCCAQKSPQSLLHSAGPSPSHASLTSRSSCLHMHGNSSLLGTNGQYPVTSAIKLIWHVKELHRLTWEERK